MYKHDYWHYLRKSKQKVIKLLKSRAKINMMMMYKHDYWHYLRKSKQKVIKQLKLQEKMSAHSFTFHTHKTKTNKKKNRVINHFKAASPHCTVQSKCTQSFLILSRKAGKTTATKKLRFRFCVFQTSRWDKHAMLVTSSTELWIQRSLNYTCITMKLTKLEAQVPTSVSLSARVSGSVLFPCWNRISSCT